MPLFSNVDWDHLLEQEPEFVPQTDDIFDTSYFDRKFFIKNHVVT
jgi:hypothetical protein